MGSGSTPPPNIVTAPASAKKTELTQVPDQSLDTQTALSEQAAKQARLNMELGAELDRTNAEFFTGQDLRRVQRNRSRK